MCGRVLTGIELSEREMLGRIRRAKELNRYEPRKTAALWGRKMTVASAVGTRTQASSATRWGQLVSVILCMVLIANLQYGWTLFVNPMKEAHPNWGFDLWWHFDSLAAIQLAFTIFIALETWLTPIEGWFVD